MIALQFNEAKIITDGGVWLAVKVTEPAPARGFVFNKKDKLYDIEIKEHREKRSLEANNYCWNLLDEMAGALGDTKENLYLGYVKKCGPFKDFTLTEDEAKTFRVAWSMLGTGWPTEQVDYAQDGDRVVIRAYYGSSRYTTKQMSRLIDMVVEDAKSLGIETLTPAELARMKEDWGNA